MFTCTRADESIDCQESPKFYELNRNFGSEEVAEVNENNNLEEITAVPAEVPQSINRNYLRRGRNFKQ